MADVAYLGPGGRPRRSRPLLRTTLGAVLRRNRLEQRRTLADVARAARVSMPYLSEVERGRKEASSEVLAAVCDALRIELSDVLTQVGRDLARDRAPVVGPVVAPVVGPLPAPVLRWDAAYRRGAPARRDVPRPGHRPGDVVLLAA